MGNLTAWKKFNFWVWNPPVIGPRLYTGLIIGWFWFGRLVECQRQQQKRGCNRNSSRVSNRQWGRLCGVNLDFFGEMRSWGSFLPRIAKSQSVTESRKIECKFWLLRSRLDLNLRGFVRIPETRSLLKILFARLFCSWYLKIFKIVVSSLFLNFEVTL